MGHRLRSVVLMLALTGSAGAATAPGYFVSASGWCGLTAYRDPIANTTSDGRFATSVITPTATGARFEGSCGVFDLFTFGPGSGQLFSGQGFGFGMGWAEPGVLRVYGEATAIIDPTEYNAGVVGRTPTARASCGRPQHVSPTSSSRHPLQGRRTSVIRRP